MFTPFAQYLNVVRTLEGYGEVVLPHCACDAYREGHVVPHVGWQALRLQAVSARGVPLVRLRSFLVQNIHKNISNEQLDIFIGLLPKST